MNATNPVTEQEAPPSPIDSSRFADVLRWLGAAAVALSGVIFLLQGLDDVDLAIRNWSYLALMATLAACGVATRLLMADAKGARLLLALAVALIPIQFAQLGGMIHGLMTGELALLDTFFAFGALSPATVATLGAATLVLFAPVAFSGFSVLARPYARQLTVAYLLPVVLLLLPWRESLPGFAVLAALGALTLCIDRHLARLDPRFRTLEGRAVRAMFAMPLAIAGVRLGFHVDALAGGFALAGLLGLGLMYTARTYLSSAAPREVLYLAGTILVSTVWALWNELLLNAHLGAYSSIVSLGPIAVFLTLAGRHSNAAAMYRVFGSVFAALSVAGILLSNSVNGPFVALLLAAGFMTAGILRREREPTLTGLVGVVVAFVLLSLQAVDHITVSSWVALAIAGLSLVVGASLIERFGRPLARQVRDCWTDVSQW